MLDQSAIITQFEEFEEIIDRFYRCDPVEHSIASVDKATDEFNGWLKTLQAQLEHDRHDLQDQLDTLQEFKANDALWT